MNGPSLSFGHLPLYGESYPVLKGVVNNSVIYFISRMATLPIKGEDRGEGLLAFFISSR